ncbi:MAG: hypothetical protein L6R38_005148 [Xanthoria sp. 2 TBL-2021]|nr:MAG: hypothetical protein L6R38_005145 [Xanthoria sp. 2 TBL-2021]KAI4278907.1 MAG: hypothetical protein L6R38_005148 [Xanthoria sp. 2 TBL-2021]
MAAQTEVTTTQIEVTTAETEVTATETEITTAGATIKPEIETNSVYLVFFTNMGETPKRVDRVYRSSYAAIEYCGYKIGIFKHAHDPVWHVKNGFWVVHDSPKHRCCVVQQRPLNKEARVGLGMGRSVGKSNPGMVYLVCALQSGIFDQGPVYWGTSFAVLEACENKGRAWDPLKTDGSFMKRGESLGIDVVKCRVYKDDDVW